MGIKFMLCGHDHKAFVLLQGDERNLIDHTYPVIVGSACSDKGLLGAAITLNKTEMTVCFTNSACEIVEKYSLLLTDKNN